MKILIAGSDINAKLLASYLKIEDNSNDIYITTDEESSDNSYTPIRIKENDIPSICDFVKYNQIEFTIVTSSMAIINGIADEFKKESFPVFAPASESARVTFFNGIAKKIMYKLKIPTVRFGIFDRENLALDYVRNSKFPVSVVNDFNLLSRFNITYNSFSKAKAGIQKIFEEGNNKIVIENYLDEESIYMYFVTDGYNALPLTSVERLYGDKYTIAMSPSGKVTNKITADILQRAVYPLLDDIIKYADMYKGILGVRFKIRNGQFFISEFYNGFESIDFQTFLPVIDDNLLDIFYEASTNGLNESRNFIKTSNNYSFTISVDKSEIEEIDGEEEFILIEDSQRYVITSSASTLNGARTKLFDYLQMIIRRETFDKIMQTSLQKELKI